MLARFQNLTSLELDQQEQDSKLSEDVLLDPDLWKNFIASVSSNSKEQLVAVSVPLSAMIFSAKSGKLLLWVESDGQQ
jgi:hypothetical protein